MPDNFIENIKEKAASMTDKAGDAIKKGGEQAAVQANRAKHSFEMWRYKPLWPDNLTKEGYSLPSIINITEEDPRCEQDTCFEAVAFDDGTKEKKALTVLASYADNLGVTFYPTVHESVYYVDPFNPDRYIDLNNYFIYLKDAKVNELNQIAQDLGATYIKITLQAEKKAFVKKKNKGEVKAGPIGKANAQQDMSQENFVKLEVASEATFKGREPQEPTLKYFQNDQNIKTLINMRMNPDNVFLGNIYRIKYSNSSGIGEKDAVKIDSVLKKLKFSGNASVQQEIEEENRYYFEYEIRFPNEELE